MILCLWSPPPRLIKVANNTRPCSKLGGTTLNWREEGGEHYIPQTCELERFDARKVVFSWEGHSIFATGWSSTGQSSARYRWGQDSTNGKPDVFWSWIVTSKLCFFSGASELFSASEGLFSLVFGGREYQGIVNHSRCIMFFSKSFWSKFKYFWHQLSKEKYNYHCMTL